MRKIFFNFIVILALSMPVVKGNDALFQQANEDYKNKSWDKAIAGYGKLLSNGQESAAVFFNLGNAWFKKNDIPNAILNYEKARKLSPGDADIQFNLKVANARIVDKIDVLPELFYKRWWNEIRSFFTADGWAIASLITLSLFFGLFTLYLVIRAAMVRRLAFFASFLVLIVFGFSMVFSSQSYKLVLNQREAIVFDPAVSVKSSPDEASTDLFMLHEGTKVKILDNLGDWYRVAIASGSDGWVSSQSLKVI